MLRMLLPVLLVIVAVLIVHALTRQRRRDQLDGPPGRGEDDGALQRARARLQHLEERYAARLETAESDLERARQDEEVLRLGPVVLGRCTVLVSGREHDLTTGTTFDLTPDGQLVVTGADWEERVSVEPTDLARAEGLVAAGRAAARSVESARQERSDRVERAWTAMEEARADRAEVDAARMTVEDIEGAGPPGWEPPEPPKSPDPPDENG